MHRRQEILIAAAFAALGLYWLLFQNAPVTGDVRRLDLVAMVLRGLATGELLREWFGGPLLAALGERLVPMGIAAAILTGAIALGWLILRAVRTEGLTSLETFVFAAAVGLGAVSTWVLAVGLAGGLRHRWLVAAPLAVGVVGVGCLLARTLSHVRAGTLPAAWREYVRPGTHPIVWLATPMVLLLVAAALLPPWDFDVREYHLQAPKEFFQQGRIGFLPHNVYANMPLGTEMHSLLAMVLPGDWWRGALAGKLVTACYALLTALGLCAAGRRWFSPGAGAVAAVIYLTTPWVFYVSGAGLIDGALAFYLFVAFYGLALEKPGLSGYLAGAAVACKYTGLLYVLVPLGAAILLLPKIPKRALVTYLLAATLGCGLWLGKNVALTGNPTYPLLYSIFGGRTWTPEKDARWNRVHRPHDFSPRALATDVSRLAWQSPWQSPIVVPLALIGLLAGWRRPVVRHLIAHLSWILATWWLFTHRIDRFWLPALPLAALLAGLGAVWSPARLWRWAMTAMLVLAAAYGTLVAGSGVIGDNRYLASPAELRADPRRVDPWVRLLNQTARSGRVLMIGEAQAFDLEVPAAYATCFDDLPGVDLSPDRSSAQIRAELADAGIFYVYVDWAEIARYRSPGNYGFTPLIDPALVDRLVADKVLEPLPAILGHPGRAYRVLTGG